MLWSAEASQFQHWKSIITALAVRLPAADLDYLCCVFAHFCRCCLPWLSASLQQDAHLCSPYQGTMSNPNLMFQHFLCHLDRGLTETCDAWLKPGLNLKPRSLSCYSATGCWSEVGAGCHSSAGVLLVGCSAQCGIVGGSTVTCGSQCPARATRWSGLVSSCCNSAGAALCTAQLTSSRRWAGVVTSHVTCYNLGLHVGPCHPRSLDLTANFPPLNRKRPAICTKAVCMRCAMAFLPLHLHVHHVTWCRAGHTVSSCGWLNSAESAVASITLQQQQQHAGQQQLPAMVAEDTLQPSSSSCNSSTASSKRRTARRCYGPSAGCAWAVWPLRLCCPIAAAEFWSGILLVG
jgi:hypothetical protein